MIYKIWKKVSTTGCEMGDGSDTRKTEIKFYVIPYTESKEFGEHRASDYGDQDYSYSVSYSCLGKFETSEVKDLMKKLGEALENEPLKDLLGDRIRKHPLNKKRVSREELDAYFGEEDVPTEDTP
jgi:hypothetical protein